LAGRLSYQRSMSGWAACPPARPVWGDEVIEADGARVFLGADAADNLDDKLLHARVDTDDQVGFMIANQPS
jgi:hypothetical protein